MKIEGIYDEDATVEWWDCYYMLSEDGISPKLDYNQLISTIVKLYDRISDLEMKLEEKDEKEVMKRLIFSLQIVFIYGNLWRKK